MTNLCFALIALSAILDISANLLLEKSDGFKIKKYGILALFFVCVAYTILAQVAKTVDLTVAYVSWGAMAIFGTVILARLFFGQRLNWIGWLGVLTVMISIVVLKTA